MPENAVAKKCDKQRKNAVEVIDMLTYEEARKIGVNACVDKLGRDFVMKYKKTSCSSYGDDETHAFCFVGVDTEPTPPHIDGEPLVLDGCSEWPYFAKCNVWYKDGRIEFSDCLLPEAQTQPV